MNEAMARMASNPYGNQTEQMNEARMASNPSFRGHAEFHQLKERPLMNSKIRDGLETGLYCERKTSHAGRPFSNLSCISGQMSGQMMHHQMQNRNKRERKYSVPKNACNKKEKIRTISYRIQKI